MRMEQIYQGVSKRENKQTWRAYCTENKRTKYIGSFSTKEEAIQARTTYMKEHNILKKPRYYPKGTKMGYLTIGDHFLVRHNDGQNRTHYQCTCRCGKKLEVEARKLRAGNTVSCGCKKQAINRAISTTNKTGVTGVAYLQERKRYLAYINVNNKRTYLGTFPTLKGAVAARKNAETCIRKQQ